MKVVIVGTGYVGLVTGSCFAEMGSRVVCVDIDKKKIDALNSGVIPIFEPGLEELVKKNVAEGRLSFSTSLEGNLQGTEMIFSAVGTPPMEDGSADMHYVLEVARSVGRCANTYFVLVTKSTVPVGTAKRVRETINEELAKRGVELDFDVASNPEFLKEGAAIKDFMSPERIVVGIDSDRVKALMERLYKPFVLSGFPILFMDIASAEMTKYAANAMLAARISFMNQVANLCELVGADVDSVRQGVGSDSRIGKGFLYSGAGYGGSCFPKDVKALSKIGREYGYEMSMIDVIEQVNNAQKYVVFEKLKRAFNGELEGKVIAIWGLAFKPDTDDMREAPSLVVIDELLKAGATVRVFDPVAMVEAKRYLGDTVVYCNDKIEAVTGANAVVLMTEWRQFRLQNWKEIRELMQGDVVVDGRNIFDCNELKESGFRYYRIGRSVE